jgi:HAD superfamily hydrolase (TIGR01484 family)
MSEKRPGSWQQVSVSEIGSVRGVCLDIDETLSTRGKLTAEAYSALWALKNAGFLVVPITGRPAGWCDHFARFWPVDAVVGENGAFVFYMENGVRKRLDTEAPGPSRQKAEALGRKILARFPQARWASDQAYREYDLAIDICEDVPAWSRPDIDALLELCAKEGAHAKLSSVHVNAWFGEFDKRKGFENWLKAGSPGAAKKVDFKDWLFIGDSPNDEPMFAAFGQTVGVANLGVYLDRLKHPPRWITKSESGAGFAEMAHGLIRARNG